MPYETGTASSMNDLMSKLSTFLTTTHGWTQDQYTASAGATDGKLSVHKNSVYTHFAWNPADSISIAMYQSLGFISAGTDIWAHTDDSGNGIASVPGAGWDGAYDDYRFISEIGPGSYTSYFFFLSTSPNDYCHVVLEYQPNTYRHFGFGELEKAWDWTGGEYCYGHVQITSDPIVQASLLPSFESITTDRDDRQATIHAEDLPGEPSANTKWGTFAPITSYSGTYFHDRAGENQIRFVGGAPGGPIAAVFNNLPSNAGDGFLPLSSVAVWYRDITPTPDNLYFMGFQPDVRTLNIRNFSPKDEVTISADTWKIFPHCRKQNVGDKNESEMYGIAYKKFT